MPSWCYAGHAPSKGEKGKTKLIIIEVIFPCTTSNRRCFSVFISTLIFTTERESYASFCAFHASREMCWFCFFSYTGILTQTDLCIIVTTRTDQRKKFSRECFQVLFPGQNSTVELHLLAVISSIFRMSATALKGTGENPQLLGYVCFTFVAMSLSLPLALVCSSFPLLQTLSSLSHSSICVFIHLFIHVSH